MEMHAPRKAVLALSFALALFLMSCSQDESYRGNASGFSLSTPAFTYNSMIPYEYTCDGSNYNPELEINNTPLNTKTLALIMDDPDAPGGTYTHWLVWNIHPGIRRIPKSAGMPFPQGENDAGKLDYAGPCPPSGMHRYRFTLYALDAEVPLPEGSSREDLEDMMQGHVIEKAELVGKYGEGS